MDILFAWLFCPFEYECCLRVFVFRSSFVAEILPIVLQSMTAFYEEHGDKPGGKVGKDFFSTWLKPGEGALIAKVNQIMTRPSPAQISGASSI